jgi:hypothetical protein
MRFSLVVLIITTTCITKCAEANHINFVLANEISTCFLISKKRKNTRKKRRRIRRKLDRVIRKLERDIKIHKKLLAQLANKSKVSLKR